VGVAGSSLAKPGIPLDFIPAASPVAVSIFKMFTPPMTTFSNQ